MANGYFNMLSFLKPWSKSEDKELKQELTSGIDSFAAPDNPDGANSIDRNDVSAPNKAYQAYAFGTNPQIQNTRQLINQYRSLTNYHEVDNAIDEIINDAIVQEDEKECVSINLDSTKWNERVKNLVQEEFKEVLRLLKFEKEGKRLYRRWYVDSRIYFHKMIDPNDKKKGIVELRLLDPRTVQFHRENFREDENGSQVYKGYREYFTYSGTDNFLFNNINTSNNNQITIPKSAMTYAHSGKVSCDGRSIIGYLHAAIKPANQLKMLEDAMVIYRVTRAPERRIFYIDVGNMQPKKATEHVNKVMQGFKNRVVYDSSTGKVKTASNNLSMTEDFWLMRRDGKATTEISTLPGAQSMGEMDDVRWFNRKLFEAMKIPLSRLPMESGGVTFSSGGDITRDELLFSKIVRGMQRQFDVIFYDPLITNLILKGVMTQEEWDVEKENIRIVYAKDSYYEELKDLEILERRINIISMMAQNQITGKYISHDTVMKNILKMTDQQIEEERSKIDEELKDVIYKPTPDELEDF
ncbi:gp20 portal vertex protein of head [Aeromonas phage 65]|uniref:Portal protein n=1 Tax=Aeromonas phage 65 TaxID=2919549 RepID=E5DRS2_9CAUD|nr:gp20 portal vertex protein of head [Aeromonas phage 65]ADQ53096.1 gp20 portal vertex protein of head [Aeromonas phage 65]